MSFIQYPMMFEPILKDRIWGGTKLHTVLGKQQISDSIGESWEISNVPENVSLVSNGGYKGQSLEELIKAYPEDILGAYIVKTFGYQFPLLFKFLDAKEDLSIQLHPNDELARARHNSLGKTEMWYVMQADPGARVVVDFKEGVTPEDYLQHLHSKTLPAILNEIPVKKGDAFFIQTGTVHAIGGGVLLAEIQQTSDITYRVYDWDRMDSEGQTRTLHVDLALEAINYEKKQVVLSYSKEENQANPLVACPFFTVNLIPLVERYEIEKPLDRFYLYVCTEGACELQINTLTCGIKQGQTVLIPASVQNLVATGHATLLEIYID
ncbi:class I mannose-6-phosphate isomerase [Myroides sp. 1354]|uniref:type I phosphomannose isomerase catalytic subunit n=1 Tax=unclassified Myroides TaxID=2642485 RepID=UPI002575F6BC|nr:MULTISPECIES: type I phosphomannose isomerase catalytic subunit [unclassified Myroides]MDM1045664.1 class I mannose-6-phosphate isomerase [Myroides sp. R163-1]MDM1056666.1 class I mannose-6-phosphate isomerase [Myroides sp. 1354]MDM1070674.1 class I mannose-6-phosphate isomerase [Myroides sp. 1372]